MFSRRNNKKDGTSSFERATPGGYETVFSTEIPADSDGTLRGIPYEVQTRLSTGIEWASAGLARQVFGGVPVKGVSFDKPRKPIYDPTKYLAYLDYYDIFGGSNSASSGSSSTNQEDIARAERVRQSTERAVQAARINILGTMANQAGPTHITIFDGGDHEFFLAQRALRNFGITEDQWQEEGVTRLLLQPFTPTGDIRTLSKFISDYLKSLSRQLYPNGREPAGYHVVRIVFPFGAYPSYKVTPLIAEALSYSGIPSTYTNGGLLEESSLLIPVYQYE